MYSRAAIAFLSLVVIGPQIQAQDKPPPTLEELVAKNISAKGGADALHALRSLRLTGKLLVNDGEIELQYVETRKRPGEIRSEATLQGMTAIEAYDGMQ